MKLSVHLITWNGGKYVPYLFASLRKQTFKDWSLLVIDNNSSDGMVDKMKKELENFPVNYELHVNEQNIGFAPAHNQAYKKTEGEYFLLLNQDMYLNPDCLGKMVEYLDLNPDVAAVSPRLMRWDFANIEKGLESTLTNQIDALGLKVFKNRRVIEQFTQQDWNDLEGLKNKKDLEVFGVSGAFPMFRRSAIKEICFDDGNFFDQNYHSYKEDVDLAFRLRQAGYKSFVILDTVAYHDRSGAGPKELGDIQAIKNKRSHSDWVKFHSYKNHLRTIIKNEYWQNFLRDVFRIKFYEIKKFLFFLLFDRKVLKGLKEIWDTRKDLFDKRKTVVKKRKIGWREMRRWFNTSI